MNLHLGLLLCVPAERHLDFDLIVVFCSLEFPVSQHIESISLFSLQSLLLAGVVEIERGVLFASRLHGRFDVVLVQGRLPVFSCSFPSQGRCFVFQKAQAFLAGVAQPVT